MALDYTLAPISPDTADVLRAGGGERYIADTNPGYPCRQCLLDAEVGEVLLLVSHDPFTIDSPYRARSPIFLHEQPCTPAATSARLPEQLTSRQLSVRAFDGNAMMVDAAVIDGADLDALLQRFFDDSSTVEVHVHNATRGCWATSVVR
ncbi:MAG TPA: DUF1203 domain-containing protein [Acidimicrobiaceae bacterium]|nr:DUF1203 domain-containing protein [Acidimicrobiaceae bacterium]